MSAAFHFHVLDAAVTLRGPERLLEPIAAAYARFRAEAPGDGAVSIVVPEDGRGEIRGVERSTPLIPGIEPTLVIYEHFLRTLMERLGRHAVLHAAALEDRHGGVFLITAPAGFGKTSLTLELVRRGHRFLSDDFAPLDPESGEISPYPRTVGIVPDGPAPIPEVFRRAAADPATPRILGKAAVDVGRVVGEDRVVDRPLPLRHVFVLTPDPETDPVAPVDLWVDMLVRAEAAYRLGRRIEAMRGARMHRRQDSGRFQHWLIHVDKELLPKPALREVLEDPAVIAAQRFGDARPDFSREPRAVALSRRSTSLALAKEMLNRGQNTRFMKRYGGNDALMWVDLAGAVGRPEIGCWSLAVGRLKDTADLLERQLERREEAAGG